jgi:hypothetical protein
MFHVEKMPVNKDVSKEEIRFPNTSNNNLLTQESSIFLWKNT